MAGPEEKKKEAKVEREEEKLLEDPELARFLATPSPNATLQAETPAEEARRMTLGDTLKGIFTGRAPPPQQPMPTTPMADAMATAPPIVQPMMAQTPAPMVAPPVAPSQTTTTEGGRTQIQGLDPQSRAKIAAVQQQLPEARAAEAGAIAAKAKIDAAAQEEVARVEKERAIHLDNVYHLQAYDREQRRLGIATILQDARNTQELINKKAEEGPPQETTAQKILNPLALALGAFGAGLTGGQNHAAEILKRDKENKMTAWKAQYQRLREKASDQHNLYAIARQHGLDDEESEAMVRMGINNQHDNMLRAIMANTKSESVIQEASRLIAQHQQENLIHDTAIINAAATKWSQEKDLKQITKEGMPAGRNLPAEQAEKLGGISASIKQLQDLGSYWDKMASGIGSGMKSKIPQTDAANFNKIKTGFVANVGRALGEKGVFTDKDFERYFGTLPDVWDTKTTKEQKMEAIQRNMSLHWLEVRNALHGAGFATQGLPVPGQVGAIENEQQINNAAAEVGATPR